MRGTRLLEGPLLQGATPELGFSLTAVSLFPPPPELEGGLENEGTRHGPLTGHSVSGSFLDGSLLFLHGKRKSRTPGEVMPPVLRAHGLCSQAQQSRLPEETAAGTLLREPVGAHCHVQNLGHG